MSYLVDALARRKRPPAGPAGSIGKPHYTPYANHDRGGRLSYGVPAPQRGVTNNRARQGAKVAAQYDRRVPSGVQFPYHNEQPIERRKLRHMGLHGGLDHIKPHRYDYS